MIAQKLNNIGYILDDVPKPLLKKLNKIVQEKKLESHNESLAGNIKKEFVIPKAKPVFDKYLFKLIQKFEDSFSFLDTPLSFFSNNDVPLKLDNMWVNFQEKHEFNPIHTHKGVYSFALWLKVPYDIEDEKKYGPGKKSNTNVPGVFSFYYTNSLGRICTVDLEVDKTWEGKIVFFPAAMPHSVNPFYTSDDYRISVSGNIAFDPA